MEDKICEMWSDGLSIEGIAVELDIDEDEVYNVLFENELI